MPTALVPLFEEFEEIEAITIIDILRRGEVEVVTAGLESVVVDGAHNITIMADLLLENVLTREFDAIILAGGAGTFRLKADQRLIEILQTHAGAGKLTAAICAAPMVLSAAGLLKHKQVTSYPSVQDQLEAGAYLTIPVVVDGNIVTSRGAGTAMAFALKLLELLQGEAIATEVAQKIIAIAA